MTTAIDKNPEVLPFVSVVMPVYNEAGFIVRSIGSILTQTYPPEKLEIVVADGMSTDNTRDLVNQLAAESPIPVILVDNPGKIAPTGLNRAISAARGEIVVRVDGHCEIEPDYVENSVKYLKEGLADGVGGPIETIGEGVQAGAIALAMSSSFGVGGSAFRTVKDREIYADTVAFPGYTREILDLAGPYNEELVRNQDDEYNYRIRSLGGRILLTPKIRSRYFSRSTFRSLWRQYFQYGYWKVRVFQLHPAQMSARQFVPCLFVLALITSFVLIFVPRVGIWPVTVLVLIYLAANFLSALTTAKQHLSLIPFLMISFAILHLSYGCGFLVGLISFSGNWFKPGAADAAQLDP